METTVTSHNETDTAAFAAELALKLQAGDVVLLYGPLGSGKTVFARALIRALMSDPALEVPSPTFTLVQTYDLPRLSVWHFDLYRLEEKTMDILELGWDDARRDGVCLVEWPDRLGGLLPRDRLEIKIGFNNDSENSRTITLSPYGSWVTRLKGIEEVL